MSGSEGEKVQPVAKLLIGFAAALAVGFVSHGPLGRGALFVDRLEAQAQAVVQDAEIPGVSVEVPRAPLQRTAVLSGPADRFQREGQGSLPGLDERMLAIPGLGRVEWTNPPPS